MIEVAYKLMLKGKTVGTATLHSHKTNLDWAVTPWELSVNLFSQLSFIEDYREYDDAIAELQTIVHSTNRLLDLDILIIDRLGNIMPTDKQGDTNVSETS